MDAKLRANFVNSIGSDVEKATPDTDEKSAFTAEPGSYIPPKVSAPAFATVSEVPSAPRAVIDETPEVETESALAQGLPEWSLVPPQVAVRKKGRKV